MNIEKRGEEDEHENATWMISIPGRALRTPIAIFRLDYNKICTLLTSIMAMESGK